MKTCHDSDSQLMREMITGACSYEVRHHQHSTPLPPPGSLIRHCVCPVLSLLNTLAAELLYTNIVKNLYAKIMYTESQCSLTIGYTAAIVPSIGGWVTSQY